MSGGALGGATRRDGNVAWAERVRSFDAYPKTHEDVQSRTTSGGVLALMSYIVIALLLLSETARWLRVDVRSRVLVDTGAPAESAAGTRHAHSPHVDAPDTKTFRVELEIDMLALECDAFSLDLMDSTGSPQAESNARAHVIKTPLDERGRPTRTAAARSASHQHSVNEMATQTAREVDERVLSQVDEESRARARSLRDEALAFVERTQKDAQYCGHCFVSDAEDTEASQESSDNGTSLSSSSSTRRPCCNTCAAIHARYKQLRWAPTFVETAEQCAEERMQRVLRDASVAARERSDGVVGCRISGTLHVRRAAGNVHIAPGTGHTMDGTNMHVHTVEDGMVARAYNMSHRVNYLRFGPAFPGQESALEGEHRRSRELGEMVQYFLKVVPTTYRPRRGRVTRSAQYSATDLTRASPSERAATTGALGDMPGIFFYYDSAPIRVEYEERREYSFLHFVVQMCAIVGGVFTVSGMVDRVVYGAQRAMQQKQRMGKSW